MKPRKLSTITTAMALLWTATASAAVQTRPTPPPCLEPAEMEAIFTYALPTVLEAAGKRCAAILPAEAYLRASAPKLVASFTVQRESYWPAARDAFTKIMGNKAEADIAMVGEQGLKILMDGAIASVIKVAAKDCAKVDDTAELLSPLSFDRLGRLMAILVSLKGDGIGGSFRACQPHETGRE